MPCFDRGRPFDDLPPLPPDRDLETTEILRACIKASRALAELKGLMGTVPDQRILLDLLPMRESESSSAMENIVSSKERLFMAASGDANSPDRFTKDILRCNSALSESNHEVPDLDTVRGICSRICDEDVRFRSSDEDEVFLLSTGSRRPSYTPPSGSAVGAKLRNLMEYVFTDDETDPLIKMAVIHYQFEAIHPFFDGNGRTGRILNVIYLQYSRLLNEPVLSLSDYLIRNKTRYYELLDAVSSRGEWEPWILFMLEAVEVTSKETVALVHGISRMMGKGRALCRERGIPVECVDVVFANPFCTVRRMAAAIGCSRPSATKYLRGMAEAGILEMRRSGRGNLYGNRPLLELFSDV